MKYLKQFNESETSNLLTEEDISDYLLEFLDNGSMKFRKSKLECDSYENGYAIKHIVLIYDINRKFRNIENVNDMENYINLISTILKICKRWNLDFKLISNETSGSYNETSLLIYQPYPKILSKLKTTDRDPNQRAYWSTEFKGKEYMFQDMIDVNKDMESIVEFHNNHIRGSGKFNFWIKKDFDAYNKIEDELIKHIEKNYILPCKFIGYGREDTYNKNTYHTLKFKLLI